MARAVPPFDVVRQFGGDVSLLTPLVGGEGTSWRAGELVLKPAEGYKRVEWVAAFLATLDPDGRFRIEAPRQTADGKWISGGWSATSWLEGQRLRGAWDRVLDVSAEFHAEAGRSPVAWPDFMTSSTTPWAIGDRVAWNQQAWDDTPFEPVGHVLASIEELRRSASGDESNQVIHGDLGGNVLFADAEGLAPAVIDMSPFFRPAGLADAIVVADAVAWEEAPLSLALRFITLRADGGPLLARAIAFRAVAAAVVWKHVPLRVEAEVAAYEPLLTLLLT